MRSFNYSALKDRKWDNEIIGYIAGIHEHKAKQELFLKQKPDELDRLVEIAKVQSTEASNKIEGIFTSNERLKKILTNKTTPRTRDEQEIAGYRDVLSTIHDSYEVIPVRPSIILQLHRDLYKFSGKSIGGAYKNADNVIAEKDNEGNRDVRFQPIPAWETPEAMEKFATDDSLKWYESMPLTLMERTLDVLNEEEDEYENLYTWG